MRQPRGHSSPGDFQLDKIRLETSTVLMRNTGTYLPASSLNEPFSGQQKEKHESL